MLKNEFSFRARSHFPHPAYDAFGPGARSTPGESLRRVRVRSPHPVTDAPGPGHSSDSRPNEVNVTRNVMFT